MDKKLRKIEKNRCKFRLGKGQAKKALKNWIWEALGLNLGRVWDGLGPLLGALWEVFGLPKGSRKKFSIKLRFLMDLERVRRRFWGGFGWVWGVFWEPFGRSWCPLGSQGFFFAAVGCFCCYLLVWGCFGLFFGLSLCCCSLLAPGCCCLSLLSLCCCFVTNARKTMENQMRRRGMRVRLQ